MCFEDEIFAMETAMEKLVTATLSTIRMKFSGNTDFMLVDEDEKFKNFFLETAKNKIDYAYNEYRMKVKFESLVDKMNNAFGFQKTLKSKERKDPATNFSTDTRHGPTFSRQIPKPLPVDISEIEKDIELQLQNELQNSLHIVGLPLLNDDPRFLLHLFRLLCDRLSVRLTAKDIESIQSEGYALTVTFRKQYKKDQVKKGYVRERYLRSNQVLQLLPGEILAKVRIYPKMTDFYRRLTCIAQCYVNKKRLFCYKITGLGLGIMFHRNSNFVYVQSQYELHEQISQYESMRRNSAKSS